ncbi:hypothetical protein C0J52_26349 [Blattella germanica]|nr:hypothetical protein C0J52_26349 [Blattella germanica]
MAVRWRYLVPLLALLVSAWADIDWSNCPQFCKCKWVSGRKAAECTNSSLNTVPRGLSSEIQILDLSGSPLHELPKDAFHYVKLINLHKLFLKDCSIQDLHKEAFRGLAILIELDLSGNHIHTLHPGIFRENVRLRILSLSRNPIQKLEDGLFSNLTFLQTVELSGCQLSHVGRKTFVNVPNLKSLTLDGNNLTTMKVETLESLYQLSGLVLHNNPWNCDCHLQAFRDWTIARNLYAQPTACVEPPLLNGKLWSDLSSEDLACKPQILHPIPGTVIEVDGGNVTLTCQVMGNPMPDVHWVFNSRIIGNYSRRTYGDQRYVVTESTSSTRWVNLTVTNVRSQDRGDYTCVAKSNGGVDERNVSLLVHYQRGAAGAGGGRGSMADIWPLIVGLVAGVLFLIAVILLLSYCYCRHRGTNNKNCNAKKVPSDGMLSSNGDISGYAGNSEQEKSLLTKVNPVQKPPRRHERPSVTSAGTELTEMKCNLLDNGSVFLSGGSVVGSEDRLEDRSLDSLDTIPQQQSQDGLDADPAQQDTARTYPPDLLTFPSRGSQVSPAGSTASTAPDSTRLPAQHGPQSPIHSPVYHPHPGMSGTLPYSRSASPFSPVVLPRQGYVTIPRRPRVPSWSSAPTPTPMGGDPLFKFEPVYDNLGPRTTADGSSVLSLNKSLSADPANQLPASIRSRPLPPTPSYHNNPLPAYYAPIEEQEIQPTPAITRATPGTRGSMRRSTPNINVTPSPNPSPAPQVASSSKPPRPDKASDHNQGRQRDSWIARSAPEGASLKRREDDPGTSSKRNSLVTSPTGSSIPNGHSREVKVPPKPPPKPKKKNIETVTTGPLFEDEGEDGTEV